MIFANIILVLHLMFILFAVFGGLLIFYKKWMPWLHIPAACWAVLIEFFGWICPLTPLENYFRTIAGQSSYGQGFIQHYLLKVIYPGGLTRQAQILLGLGVLSFNLLVYSIFLKKEVVKKLGKRP